MIVLQGRKARDCAGVAALACAFFSACAMGVEITQVEWEQMKKEIADLRKERQAPPKPVEIKGSVDKALDNKYGPDQKVGTKQGKLTIAGLVQVWYYSIQNDNEGLFEDNVINDVNDTGEAIDNDSFRIRRTELKFTMDIHENVRAVVMVDPAREASSFPSFSANTGTSKRGINQNVGNTQTGAGAVPRLLQDAFINYHDVVPHHDFQVGQYKPPFGDEGIRSSGELDFVERSFIGQIGDARDLGATVHGQWWDKDRFQYWLSVFDGAGNYHGSAGQFQNRADDNDEKDFGARILIRPLWQTDECGRWGKLELGYSVQAGIHGESSSRVPGDDPINGLNRRQTAAIRHGAWASYFPSGPVKGWWLRGEWASFKDRHIPNTVADLTDEGTTGTQDGPAPFRTQGWYFATGYKLSQSAFADSGCPHWWHNLEFTFRYDVFQNVQVADLVNPERETDVFKTQVWTGGINYYIKGHNAKLMLNYNVVNDPDEESNAGRNFNRVRNDNIVVSFQVAF